MSQFSKILGSACALLAGLAACTPSASAAPLCTSLTQTIAGYAGQSCTVGDVLFTFGSNPYTSSTGVSSSNVGVQIVGTGLPGVATGFTFAPTSGSWKADNGGDSSGPFTADVNLAFAISFDPTFNSLYYAFVNSSLTLNTTIVNGFDGVNSLSYDGVGETLTDQNNNALPGINLNVYASNSAAFQMSSGWTAKGINISKDNALYAYAASESSVTTNGITELATFIAVPEPGQFVLMGTGLGLLLLVRRRKKVLGFFGVAVALLAIGTSNAHASGLCTSTTLSTYDTPGFTCTFSNFTFSNFSYTINTNTHASGFGNSTTTTPDTSVTVNPLIGGFQLALTSPFTSTSGNAEVNFTFAFQVSSLAPIIGFASSNTVTTSQYPSGSGGCSPLIACVSDTALLGTSALGSDVASQSYAYPSTLSGNSLGLNVAPGTNLFVTDTIDLHSAAIGDSTHISNLTTQLSATPEPVTMSLVGGALLALGVFTRAKRSKNA